MSPTNAELLTLLAHPGRLDAVPADAIPGLIGAAATLQAQLQAELWARLQAGAQQSQPTARGGAEPDQLLDAKTAAARLGVDPRWMYRHADELPFTRRLTSGTLRFSARGLERWKESRK